MMGPPVVSEDGGIVAYRATVNEDDWFIVANGKRVSDSFEDVSDPAISRDGTSIAFAAEGTGKYLFLGEKKIPIAESPRSVFLSPDGRAWGYLTRSAVVTERGRSEDFEEVGGPEFSPDGGRVAFWARRGKQGFVVIGDLKVDAPGLVAGPYWSADGRRVGYGALLGRELWWKVVDVR
jgi:hypothetical protein